MEQPAPRQAHQQQLSSSNGSSQLTWQKKGWLLQKQHHQMTCVMLALCDKNQGQILLLLCVQPFLQPFCASFLCVLFGIADL